nr:DUF2399 domain-containing protein [Actinacidiphila oryziradicis]
MGRPAHRHHPAPPWPLEPLSLHGRRLPRRGHRDTPRRAAHRTPAESPWDPALASALAELGVRVEEEAVLGDLLSDLAG